MLTSPEWFILMAVASILAGAVGVGLGRGSQRRWRLTLVVALVVLGVTVWMVRHPAVSVTLVPLDVLSHLEGVAPVPVVMLLLGMAWSISRVRRQRFMVAAGGAATAVFFAWGGMWMLQTTPEDAFDNQMSSGPVLQSQSYSCVAASTASTLNLLGLGTTEAEMASLTRTRPGMGATMVRTLHGVRQRLRGTGYRADLVEASLAELSTMPVPALTSLRLSTSNLHMVTLLRVSPTGAWLLDPQEGCVFYPSAELRQVYSGELIVFSSTGPRLTPNRSSIASAPPVPDPATPLDTHATTIAALGG